MWDAIQNAYWQIFSKKKIVSEMYLKYIFKKCMSVPELFSFPNRNYDSYLVFMTVVLECYKYREQHVTSQNY